MRGASLAALIALLVSGVVYLAGFRTETATEVAAKRKAAPQPPVPVVATEAKSGNVPVRLPLMGRAEAYENVAVRSQVDGQVAAVRYADGQHVHAGDVLVNLVPDDYEVKLAQAEAALARDRAQLDKARSDYRRYSARKARPYVTREQLTQYRTAAEAAEATVKADEAAAVLARLQLSYTTISAPISGKVGARLISPGALVTANNTSLAIINRVSPIYVTFAVPEKYLPQIHKDLMQGPLAVDIAETGNSEAIRGEAQFLDNAVDPTTGTIVMKALLPNRDERFTSGQSVNVSLIIDILRNVVTVPAAAVQQSPRGSFLFVVQKDGVVSQRPVEVPLTQRGLAVVKGVNAGEMVVTDGQLRLTPGARVHVTRRD